MDDEWQYYGEWKQYMLFTEPWFHAFDSEIFSFLQLPFRSSMQCLDGQWFLHKENISLLEKTVEPYLFVEGWFEDFFSFFDTKISAMLVYEKNEDLFGFLDALIELMSCSSLLEHLDVALQNILPATVSEFDQTYDSVMHAVRPSRQTHMMRYHQALRNGASEDSLLKEYEWIGTHGFEGDGLTVEKIQEDREKLVASEQESIFVKDELKRIVMLCSELVFYRSQAIETMDKVIFAYRDILTLLGKKYSLRYEEVISCTIDELRLLQKKGIVPEGLASRGRSYGVVRHDGKFLHLYKGVAEELAKHRVFSEDKSKLLFVTGRTAFPGKVVGVARVLHTADDLAKMQEGDVLIAHETTPQYVPAMRKAAAFVTNSGGITSHASIMSREMQKPCVVGTKIATQVFSDGDVVEVDAENGVVRKIM